MNRYKLEITGSSCQYFLSHLIKKKIRLYFIDEGKNRLIIIVDKEDYDRIKKIKTSCKIKVLNRYGIEKIRYLIYKYRYLLLFFLMGLFFLIVLSHIIFSIEVIHPKKEIRDLVYQDLEQYGLEKYHFILSYQKKEKIKKQILQKEKERLEWLEIDLVPTRYVINVEERKKKEKTKDSSPQNIVAKKDAMILDIEASQGEILKKKYDYVKKGDVIISGTIKNKDTEVSKIRADGEVFGEVWYKIQVEIPTYYREEEETGEKKKVFTLRFLTHDFSLEFKKYKNYSFDEISLFKNPVLPISFVLEEKKETIVKEEVYNIHNIDKKALEIAESKFKRKDIISKKVLKKTLNNSKIVVDIFFKIRENITDYQRITDLSLKEDIEDE